MSIHNYMSAKTIKSEPLTNIDEILVPDSIENYAIRKDQILYKSETSVIYPCCDMQNNEECVVKIMCNYNEKIIDSLYEKCTQSEYIVKILTKGYITGGGWYQVFPMYKDGNVAHHIANMNQKKLMKMLHDVNEALNFLHNEVEIVHMDVKPENIFITSDGDYVLGDYDIAKNIGSVKKRNDIELTEEYKPDDWENEKKYTAALDYAILGKVITKMTELNSKLLDSSIKNIIRGLNNSVDNRWGYKEISEVCSGKYIDSNYNTKAQRLTIKQKTTNLLIGFDKNDLPIYARNLEELGLFFRKYSEIVLKRYIENKNSWITLINFVYQYDEKKAELINDVMKDVSSEKVEILDKISQILLPYENHLYYKENIYADFESVLNDTSSRKFDVELINLVKNSSFKKYLSEVGNEDYKRAFEMIENMSNIREETLYFLILYCFKEGCSFEKEILGIDANTYSEKVMMSKIRETLCTDIELLNNNIPQLEAWLILKGYIKEINKIMEVSLKYE